MISIQKKFLFIHVPKTGGNSIQNILRNYSEDDIVILSDHQDGIERFEVRNKKYNINKHSTITDYKSQLGARLYCSMFKFATIRNPWDLMISFYFSPHRKVTEWRRNEFITLVNKIANLRHFICEKSLTERLFNHINFFAWKSKKPLDADIDFLMRFEHLESDFKIVCEKLDIPFSPLPKRNASERKHYSVYYDDELIEMVGQKFHEEIQYGLYEFQKY